MDLLRTKVADGSVLSLIEAFLKAGIMDGLSTWTPEEGAPQGAVLSPLLSNIYLDPLDHLMADSGIEMVRYADDFVILCRTAEQAERALEMVREWTEAHGLKLHPTKTKIVDVRSEGFEFLGYRFADGKRTPRPKSMKKLKDTIRGKTLRTSGKSLSCIIAELNPILRGWFAYFQHSHVWTFGSLDGWIRMRLRSILRKRCNLRGRGRGCDHQRWPNVFFAKHGLFSLKDAHALACQSSSR
jgi:RNA-directed DNA polymerase